MTGRQGRGPQGDTPLMRQMAQAMTQLLESQGREDCYRSFKVHDPPVFKGGSDPMEAEEWINQMEEIFRITRCTDQDKVELAAYKLHGEATHWWLRYRERMEDTQAQLTWAQFKEMFLDKYFPTSLKDQKEAKFLML